MGANDLHDDVVNGNVDKFNKVADKAHNGETDTYSLQNFKVL